MVRGLSHFFGSAWVWQSGLRATSWSTCWARPLDRFRSAWLPLASGRFYGAVALGKPGSSCVCCPTQVSFRLIRSWILAGTVGHSSCSAGSWEMWRSFSSWPGWVRAGAPPGPRAASFGPVVCVQLYLIIVNLFPSRLRVGGTRMPTDGLQLLQLLWQSRDQAAQLRAAYATALSKYSNGNLQLTMTSVSSRTLYHVACF